MTKPTLTSNTYALTDSQDIISGNFLDYAFDPDAGDSLTIANVDGQYTAGAIGGGKGTNTIIGTYGVLTVYQDGTFTYNVNDGLNLKAGESVVEDFSVKIRDLDRNYSSAVFKFVINGTTNERPIAIDDFGDATSGFVSGNILANDSDPNHDILHVASITSALDGSHHVSGLGTVVIHGLYGDLTINSDTGAYSYTNTSGAHGVTEVFDYKAADNQNSEPPTTDPAHIYITL